MSCISQCKLGFNFIIFQMFKNLWSRKTALEKDPCDVRAGMRLLRNLTRNSLLDWLNIKLNVHGEICLKKTFRVQIEIFY